MYNERSRGRGFRGREHQFTNNYSPGRGHSRHQNSGRPMRGNSRQELSVPTYISPGSSESNDSGHGMLPRNNFPAWNNNSQIGPGQKTKNYFQNPNLNPHLAAYRVIEPDVPVRQNIIPGVNRSRRRSPSLMESASNDILAHLEELNQSPRTSFHQQRHQRSQNIVQDRIHESRQSQRDKIHQSKRQGSPPILGGQSNLLRNPLYIPPRPSSSGSTVSNPPNSVVPTEHQNARNPQTITVIELDSSDDDDVNIQHKNTTTTSPSVPPDHEVEAEIIVIDDQVDTETTATQNQVETDCRDCDNDDSNSRICDAENKDYPEKSPSTGSSVILSEDDDEVNRQQIITKTSPPPPQVDTETASIQNQVEVQTVTVQNQIEANCDNDDSNTRVSNVDDPENVIEKPTSTGPSVILSEENHEYENMEIASHEDITELPNCTIPESEIINNSEEDVSAPLSEEHHESEHMEINEEDNVNDPVVPISNPSENPSVTILTMENQESDPMEIRCENVIDHSNFTDLISNPIEEISTSNLPDDHEFEMMETSHSEEEKEKVTSQQEEEDEEEETLITLATDIFDDDEASDFELSMNENQNSCIVTTIASNPNPEDFPIENANTQYDLNFNFANNDSTPTTSENPMMDDSPASPDPTDEKVEPPTRVLYDTTPPPPLSPRSPPPSPHTPPSSPHDETSDSDNDEDCIDDVKPEPEGQNTSEGEGEGYNYNN